MVNETGATKRKNAPNHAHTKPATAPSLECLQLSHTQAIGLQPLFLPNFLVPLCPSSRLCPLYFCEQNTSHVTYSRVLHTLISMSHVTLAQRKCLARITSCHHAFGCAFDLRLFDPLLCTLHRLSHLPFLSPVLHLHLPCGLVR